MSHPSATALALCHPQQCHMEAGSEGKVWEKVLPTRLPPSPQPGGHIWGCPSEALYSTTWEHVLIFKHVSSSSCNHMLIVKPHAEIVCMEASVLSRALRKPPSPLLEKNRRSGMDLEHLGWAGWGVLGRVLGTWQQLFPRRMASVQKTWSRSTWILLHPP